MLMVHPHLWIHRRLRWSKVQVLLEILAWLHLGHDILWETRGHRYSLNIRLLMMRHLVLLLLVILSLDLVTTLEVPPLVVPAITLILAIISEQILSLVSQISILSVVVERDQVVHQDVKWLSLQEIKE